MFAMLSRAFLLGLATAPFCAAACAPVFLPVVLSREKARFGAQAAALGEFLLGRLVAYAAVGLVVGWIGGAAGAVPPLVGWAATRGSLSWTAVYLFAIIFYWTPPHFWALSLLMKDEYAKVGVPMMPVARGERETRRQIVLYTLLLYVTTQLPFCAGEFGGVYLAASIPLGLMFIGGSVLLYLRADRRSALRLYLFSLLYLALLFGAMVADVKL